MKRRMGVLVIGLLLLLTLACGGGGTASGVQIEVVNRTPEDVCYVYISETDSDAWGDDQLGGEETIVPGKSQTFDFPAGEYDVRLENCDEVAMANSWKISRSTKITAGESGATSWVMLDNSTGGEVCYVFISPSAGDDWGDDRMGENEVIPAGEQRMFYMKPGTYDLQALDCDENVLAEEYEVDLSIGRPWELSGN
jgi:hypothetical protein